MNDPRITSYGIVTESKATEIFKQQPGFQCFDHKFFMDVLVSVDLALRLTSHQITIESRKLAQINETETFFYMPDVRITPPDLICKPSALHLLYSTNNPICHLQIKFARVLLNNTKLDAQLVFKEESPVNITKVRLLSSKAPECVDIEMRYLGETVAFEVPSTADEDIRAAIVQSCHQIMDSKWGRIEHDFAVVCRKDPYPHTSPHRKYHLLPDDILCETCVDEHGLDKTMSIWDTALRKVC